MCACGEINLIMTIQLFLTCRLGHRLLEIELTSTLNCNGDPNVDPKWCFALQSPRSNIIKHDEERERATVQCEYNNVSIIRKHHILLYLILATER